MPEPSIEFYNAAIDAVQAGRLPEALEAIENSLTEDPNDPETWQLYVVILNAVGRTEDAKKATLKLKELGLGEADDFLIQASQAAGTGDLASAISLYQSAIESDPTRADAHAGLAFTLLQNGDEAQALASAETAVALSPDDPRANFSLGHILRLAGERDRALIALTAAIEAEPELMIAIYEQGMIFAETDRLEEALQNFERFLEMHPDDESATQAVAEVRARLGRTDTF